MDILDKILDTEFDCLLQEKDIAIAVSGGPDSMALAMILKEWVGKRKTPQIHILIVDHGLREESGSEAKQVAKTLKNKNFKKISVLKWAGSKPKTKIQEAARAARYDLMAQYCTQHKIKYLCLAHHQEDQAETILLRLASGSGLDGLSGIRSFQRINNLTLARPLLSASKAMLMGICKTHQIDFVNDPSNQNPDYARVRLRAAQDILSKEGLTAKRLSTTALRLKRASDALDQITEKQYKNSEILKNTKQIVLNFSLLKNEPAEIFLRIIGKAIKLLSVQKQYPLRMEKLEALVADLMASKPFRKRTLAGLIFSRDDRAGHILIEREK